MEEHISQQRPVRQHLHRIPVWIPMDQAVIYFVTLCCAQRKKIFISPCAVQQVLVSLAKVGERYGWKILQVCVMPDHVHLFVSPILERDQSLSAFVKAWKSSSKQRLNRQGVEGDIWQREFFDRLLRSEESFADKWNYVMMNPVRAELCETPEDYPFLGTVVAIMHRLQVGE